MVPFLRAFAIAGQEPVSDVVRRAEQANPFAAHPQLATPQGGESGQHGQCEKVQ